MSNIHPTAVVDPNATIHPSVQIGPFAVVESDVVVGRDCEVGAHAVLKQYTRLGEGNRISEGAVLGGCPQDLKWSGHRSFVEIGSHNIFREGVTVNRSTSREGVTRIGNHCFLMINSHVAHECSLGDHVVLANNVALAGHVSVGDRAILSGGAGVHQFCNVGTLAMVGGNAKVVRDVLPYFLADGMPARHRCLNLVGLRRQGLDRDGLRALKDAYRKLAATPGLLPKRLQDRFDDSSPLVVELLEFIRKSQRGYSSFGKTDQPDE